MKIPTIVERPFDHNRPSETESTGLTTLMLGWVQCYAAHELGVLLKSSESHRHLAFSPRLIQFM